MGNKHILILLLTFLFLFGCMKRVEDNQPTAYEVIFDGDQSNMQPIVQPSDNLEHGLEMPGEPLELIGIEVPVVEGNVANARMDLNSEINRELGGQFEDVSIGLKSSSNLDYLGGLKTNSAEGVVYGYDYGNIRLMTDFESVPTTEFVLGDLNPQTKIKQSILLSNPGYTNSNVEVMLEYNIDSTVINHDGELYNIKTNEITEFNFIGESPRDAVITAQTDEGTINFDWNDMASNDHVVNIYSVDGETSTVELTFNIPVNSGEEIYLDPTYSFVPESTGTGHWKIQLQPNVKDYEIHVSDVNGDGKDDLIIAVNYGGTNTESTIYIIYDIDSKLIGYDEVIDIETIADVSTTLFDSTTKIRAISMHDDLDLLLTTINPTTVSKFKVFGGVFDPNAPSTDSLNAKSFVSLPGKSYFFNSVERYKTNSALSGSTIHGAG